MGKDDTEGTPPCGNTDVALVKFSPHWPQQ